MSSITNYPDSTFYSPVTMTAGQTTSPAVNLHGTRLVGLIFDSAPTPFSLGFEFSPDGGATWYTAYDEDGLPFELAVQNVGWYLLWPTRLVGVSLVRFTFDEDEASDVVITCVSRAI